MPRVHPGGAPSVLPLLLALPAGTIAGLHQPDAPLDPGLEASLARFGPRLRTEAALRHAAIRPPPQAVVELEPGATVASDTALSLLSAAGTVVFLLSPDLGTLGRVCHRILLGGGPASPWVAAESLRAGRCLRLRVKGVGSERWVRLPMDGAPAEGILAACRATGLVVLESRVDYEWAVAR
jgi:hypothetical protein